MRTLMLGVLVLASSALAQERAVVMEVKFTESAAELVSKREVEAPAPRQFGTPQLEPLFFEVTDERGGVLYSASIGDPRPKACHPQPLPGDAAPPPTAPAEEPKEGVVDLRFPAAREARLFTIWQQPPGSTRETARQKMLEVTL